MDNSELRPEQSKRGTKTKPEAGASSLAVARAAFLMAIFVAGGLTGSIGGAPFPTLRDGLLDTLTLWEEITRTRPAILEPISYPGTGLVSIEPSAAQPGYTLIQGLLPGGPQIRMVDLEGIEIHRWTVDFFEAWPEPRHIVPATHIPKSRHNFHTQGFWPLPDGSILANIGGHGAVLLDRCSKPVWTIDRMTHHSVTPTPDGRFWIPGHIPVYDTPAELLPAGYGPDEIARMLEGTLKNYNDSVLLVDGRGNVEKEFSVLQAIYDAGLEHALHASLHETIADPTHINDIDLVTESLARRLEGVAPGDLLVSSREMNMLAILDQNDGRLKWYEQGPWFRQHDPDIMPDGTIEIFNNRSKALSESVRGSQIVSYDPRTSETRVLHPAGEEDGFYSPFMGTHQRLANGNLLITESAAGRAFEVTPEGKVVWDYRLPYDDEVASLFEQGMRVAHDYFDVENWSCEEG